jgi:hypothetical protein
MLLSKNNIVIFSQQRTGTKLLSKILEEFGYHNHGEWYALFSTCIKNNKALRRPTRTVPDLSKSEHTYHKLREAIKRYNVFKPTEKSVITIWPDALLEFPFMLQQYENCHWVCLKRDPWEQLLSWYISSKNYNFDGLFESKPVLFKEDAFRRIYWEYHKVNELQNWLIENKSATEIKFEDLILGNATAFGQPYIVNSKDEHIDLESLVINLNDVKAWFAKLEKIRLSNVNYFTNSGVIDN